MAALAPFASSQWISTRAMPGRASAASVSAPAAVVAMPRPACRAATQ